MAQTLTFHTFAGKAPEHGQQIVFFGRPEDGVPNLRLAEVVYNWSKKGKSSFEYDPKNPGSPGEGYVLIPVVFIQDDSLSVEDVEELDEDDLDDMDFAEMIPARDADCWCPVSELSALVAAVRRMSTQG